MEGKRILVNEEESKIEGELKTQSESEDIEALKPVSNEVFLPPCDGTTVNTASEAPHQEAWRKRLKEVIHSYRYQVALMVLVVVEACLVVVELVVQVQGGEDKAVDGLHSAGLALLSFFVLELLFRLAVLGLELLRAWMEVVDGVVVIVALVLEAVSLHHHHQGAVQAGGLIITLRLWRIIRIQNSVLATARLASERKLAAEHSRRMLLEREVVELQNTNDKLTARCSILELALLQRNGEILNATKTTEGQPAWAGE